MVETLAALWIYHRHGIRAAIVFGATVAALQFADSLVVRYTGASIVAWALFQETK